MRVLRGVAAALTAVHRGLAVFALPAGGRRPEPGWHRRCTTDPAAVRRWWVAGYNIGVGCRASDVVGLDLDHRPGIDGTAVFAAMCAAHRVDWPDTFNVATPHGRHLYFRAGGRPIASASGRRSPLGLGVDIRGPGHRYGGYLVGPESIVDGQPYRIARDTAIRDLPPWLAAALAAGPAHTTASTPRGAAMDPDHTLANIRRLAAREDLSPEDAAYLAELVEALDEWISKGGYLPRPWAQAHDLA
jgi:hypothetical protein